MPRECLYRPQLLLCALTHTHTQTRTLHIFFFFFLRGSQREFPGGRLHPHRSLLHCQPLWLFIPFLFSPLSLLPDLTFSGYTESSQFLLVSALFCSCTLQQTILHLSQRGKCLNCLHVSTQGGSGSSTSTAADSNGRPQDLQMSENLIYYSREEGKDTKTVYSYDLKRRTQHRRSSGIRRI